MIWQQQRSNIFSSLTNSQLTKQNELQSAQERGVFDNESFSIQINTMIDDRVEQQTQLMLTHDNFSRPRLAFGSSMN